METVTKNKETWFKIAEHDKLRPFFMSIVSDSNHWMFISSNGGLSAGRKNNEHALFPYYTDDKITESADITGSKTIFQVGSGDKVTVWEPFSVRFSDQYKTTRNLFKNFYGNKVLFEEINHTLGLTFRYEWNSSNLYGFTKKSELINHSGSEQKITMLDGIQNILPHGVAPDMQQSSSNLVDAYKRNELHEESGVGIYALSAIIVDKAEPSEALKANIAWSLGIENPNYLVSSLQLENFRNLKPIQNEVDIKGEKGAYFVHKSLDLSPSESKEWKIVANVNQNKPAVIALIDALKQKNQVEKTLEQDIKKGTELLIQLTSAADGTRITKDTYKDARHYSNVLFNIMRGGTFDNNYQIEKHDFVSYLENANNEIVPQNTNFIDKLNEEFTVFELNALLDDCEDPDLYRLSKEYLPLKFSRRHGDPSRPWNKFTINTHSEVDGSKILDYEGNWRDIFQNWETLVHSYPGFIEGMIFKFLNNSTFDGYNPYRVTKNGFDWETIEPDNPWSYIGYWGDHQIIYLLKFLEFYQDHHKEGLKTLFSQDSFVYANVPYRIKSYSEISKDPKNTIDFDQEQDKVIRANVTKSGADGALLGSSPESIYHVNFLEKILASVLAKVSNFIPECGIWMNTQRPEWNDANNALVGNGVSMVTLYYLWRFLKFFEKVLADADNEKVLISKEQHGMFIRILIILEDNQKLLDGAISDEDRKKITDALGLAANDYRAQVYNHGFSGEKVELSLDQVSDFVSVTLAHLKHAIEANRRSDDLFHSYNLMSFTSKGISISHLYEMLEGQVAILSSGYLNSEEAANLLDALKSSVLYRKDQNSYMLYPNKELPGFLEKNNIPSEHVEDSQLLQKLVNDGNQQIITKDIRGGYHFNGNLKNAGDVATELQSLNKNGYKTYVEQESEKVLEIFEEVFNHKAFTGRSGTFFAYEGLGSIYWHMVSKLHLAVEEICQKAAVSNSDESTFNRLLTHFYDIGEGIGIHKSPKVYGAFPTDPYSHTPKHRGAQQPGMTGQVKEDILVAFGETGVKVNNGQLSFAPVLLRKKEFLNTEKEVRFINIHQESEPVVIPENGLGFSCCQVPVIYQIADSDEIEVILHNNKTKTFTGLSLDEETSKKIFNRSGEIMKIYVRLKESHLV